MSYLRKRISKRVFLRAAKYLCQGDESYACCAIDTAILRLFRDGNGRSHEEDFFHAWFKPEHASRWSPFYGDASLSENREARIMALILCDILNKEGQQP